MTACRDSGASLPRSLSPVSRKLAGDVHRLLARHRSATNLRHFLFSPASIGHFTATSIANPYGHSMSNDSHSAGSGGFSKDKGLTQPERSLALGQPQTRKGAVTIPSPATGRSSINSPVSHVAMWGPKSRSRQETKNDRAKDPSLQPGSSNLSITSTASTGCQRDHGEGISNPASSSNSEIEMKPSEQSIMVNAELETLKRDRDELEHLRIANRELLVANDYLLQEHGRIVQDLRKRLKDAQSELDKWNLAYTALPHRFMPADSEDHGA